MVTQNIKRAISESRFQKTEVLTRRRREYDLFEPDSIEYEVSVAEVAAQITDENSKSVDIPGLFVVCDRFCTLFWSIPMISINHEDEIVVVGR